jgi:hypothetical protein
MPVLTKSVKILAEERAAIDGKNHYSDILSTYETLHNSSKDTESFQDLLRLKKWIFAYIKWAEKWHSENMVAGDDMFVDPKDFMGYPPRPVAPRKIPFETL